MSTKTFDISNVAGRKAFVHAMKSGASSIHAARVEGTNFTQVIMEFPDGWQIQGTSVCVNPDDYKFDMGCIIARENIMADADIHYWRTVGYLALIGQQTITVPWKD